MLVNNTSAAVSAFRFAGALLVGALMLAVGIKETCYLATGLWLAIYLP